MFKKILYSVLGLLMLFAGYIQFINPGFIKDIQRAKNLAAMVTQVEPVSLDKTLTTVTEVPPSQMRQSLEDLYRPKPDRRFLSAIGEIHEFFTGQSSEIPELEFKNNQWQVRYLDESVGALSPYPDFPEYLNLLKQWVKHLNQKHPIPLLEGGQDKKLEADIQLDKFYHPYIAEVARNMNAMWSEGDRYPWVLHAAVRSMVLLAFQNLDRMEIGDLIPGTALAWLALAQDLTSASLVREEILLAEMMKYSAHALQKSKSLPKSHPLRLFVERKEKKLERAARSRNSDPLSRFLWLHRLAERGELEPWENWFAKGFGHESLYLPLLKTGLDMRKFISNRGLPRVVQQVILLDLEREGEVDSSDQFSKATLKSLLEQEQYSKVLSQALGLDSQLYTLIGHFEKRLSLLDDRYQGPFLKNETYKTFYRGYFYSSVYVEGLFYLDSLSAVEIAQAFSHELGKGTTDWATRLDRLHKNVKKIINNQNSPQENSFGIFRKMFNFSGTARDFKVWFDHLVDAHLGRGDIKLMVNDLTELSYLGVPAALRSWKEIKKHLKTADTAQWISLRRLFQRMDARPEHLYQMYTLAKDDLMDPIMTDLIVGHLLRLCPNRYEITEAWYAHYQRDTKKLLKIMKNSRTNVSTRIYVLGLLNGLDFFSSKALIKEYDSLVRKYPDNWYLRKSYAAHLAKKKQYAKARKVISKWLKRSVRVGGLEVSRAHTRMAQYYFDEGRYSQAWKENLIALESGTGDSMTMAGRILMKLNRHEEAGKVFFSAYTRYPGTKSLALLMGYFWTMGKPEIAAKLLDKHSLPIYGFGWSEEIGKEFSEAFEKRPVKEGVEAFKYLIPVVDYEGPLMGISKGVHRRGNDRLAFELLTRLPHTNFMEGTMRQVWAATYLKSYAGTDQAVKWLRRSVPHAFGNLAPLFIYLERDYDLLWKYANSPDESIWLLLAAASLKEKNLSPKYRKKMMSYYNLPGVEKGDYGLMGLYLLGKIPEKKIIQVMLTPKKRCEYAYYLGVKAESEGRYRDAVSWYRTAVETEQRMDFEYMFSLKALNMLSEKGQSLIYQPAATGPAA